MNIEATVISFLGTELSVPVSGDIPHAMPTTFVTVEKTGGGRTNHVMTATLAVQSWAGTREQASELNEAVKEAMFALIELDNVSRSELDADYNYTDEETGRFRYQAVFDIVYLNS